MFKRTLCALTVIIQSIGLLFVSPIAYAASSSLVIYQLQTGASGAATQEFISLYNNSSDPQEVTGWCITKSSASDISQSQLGCVVSPEPSVKIMLPSHASLTLATNEFVTAHPGFVPDIIFKADLAAASGHIRIFDPTKQEIDRLGWGTAAFPEGTASPAHASGKILQRQAVLDGTLKDTDDNVSDFTQTTLPILNTSSLYEEEIPVDICGNIDGLQISLPENFLFDQAGKCIKDACSNINLLQINVPDGYLLQSDGSCALVQPENATLVITELLPNVTSYDTNKEFIEIYNPNGHVIDLKGYALQLGPSFDKSYPLPVDQTILPGAYLAFSDTVTGIVLSNTSATLRLVAPAGNIVSEVDTYLSPAEESSWVLIGTNWQYSNQPTPGTANVASLEAPVSDEEVSGLAPCSNGQYRSAETNRCRLLQPAVSAVTPCKAGQERNPDTNRCRTNVLSAISNLLPCKEGQERNPETNRCRAIAASTLSPCGDGQERNPDTNRCRRAGSTTDQALAKVQDVATISQGSTIRWWLVGAAILLALAYAIYEWRQDITNLIHKHRAKKITKT